MRLCTHCGKGVLREGSIYRTRDDDGRPRALPGLECTACGAIEPDVAHIAEALGHGAEVSPWVQLQLEVAVAARLVAGHRFAIPIQAMALKRIAVEWPGPRRVLN
jgi:hypothetical protein